MFAALLRQIAHAVPGAAVQPRLDDRRTRQVLIVTVLQHHHRNAHVGEPADIGFRDAQRTDDDAVALAADDLLHKIIVVPVGDQADEIALVIDIVVHHGDQLAEMLGADVVRDEHDMIGLFPFQRTGDAVGVVVELLHRLQNALPLVLVHIAVVVQYIRDDRFAHAGPLGDVFSGNHPSGHFLPAPSQILAFVSYSISYFSSPRQLVFAAPPPETRTALAFCRIFLFFFVGASKSVHFARRAFDTPRRTVYNCSNKVIHTCLLSSILYCICRHLKKE